jgi:ferritin heavy chain
LTLVFPSINSELHHYQFVDYLTGEFLDEQYKGQRDLAGKIATLGKMVAGQGAELGEFLFDKQLL